MTADIPANRKLKRLLPAIWANNKLLILLSAAQIPFLVLLPYLKAFMPKVIIESISKHFSAVQFVLAVALISLAVLLFSVAVEWLSGRTEWYNKVFVNTLLKYLDEKTLTTDYENIEKMTGQQKRQKALNAAYGTGQRLFALTTSLAVNICGFVLYGFTVSYCNFFVFALIFLTTLMGYAVNRHIQKYEQEQKEAVADADRKLRYLETDMGTAQAGREIRLYGMTDMLLRVYKKCADSKINIERKICWKRIMGDAELSITVVIRNLGTYLYLALMVYQNRIGMGDFVLLIGMVTGLSKWTAGILADLAEMKKISLYLDDYFAYLDMPEKSNGSLDLPAQMSAPAIRFENVCFRYEGAAADTLHGINLSVAQGEKLAVVGRNGAGKTTLIKLLTGLYRPTAGTVFVNGVEISDYRKEEYNRALAAVFQDILLLPVAIEQNVSSHIHEKTDRDRVHQCLNQADLGELVKRLPDGVETAMDIQVKTGAVELSGGERQKLLIAKAVYKDGRIIILDEPTAALDPISESDIYGKYNSLTENATSLFVSHRLASTSFCDRIILMEDGGIAEEGSHEELIALEGKYCQMYRQQSQYYKSKGSGAECV